MKKQLLNIMALAMVTGAASAQVLYSERFNSVSPLTSSSTGASAAYLYGDVPSSMFTINNGNKTATTSGSSGATNAPFCNAGQSQKAWLSEKPSSLTDTFAVSTSWLNPAGQADMWLITPTISGIAANTVLTWEGLAPDGSYPDGYEVYVTTNTSSAPVVGDFTAPNMVFSIASEGSSGWNQHGVSLSAYAGQSIRIAFRNHSNDMDQLWLDDIVVQNLANARDVMAVSEDTYKYTSVGSGNSIMATIKNLGYSNLTSVALSYQVGTGSVVSQTFAVSPSLGYQGSQQMTFATPFNTSTAGYYDVKVWVSGVNGSNDQVNTNDTAKGPLTVSTAVPAKKVFVEEFTGAWCGYCPDGYSKLRDLINSDPNVLTAALHDNDNMSTTEGNSLIADYASGFPEAVVDQYFFADNGEVGLDRSTWANYASQRESMVVPATVTFSNVTYNSGTRQISATVNTTFLGDVKGDYRINMYVIENNVYGDPADQTDNDWNQHSYFYTTSGSEWYHVGTTGLVSGQSSTALMFPSQYKHQHVVDKIAGTAYGTSGIIPMTGGTQGQTYSKTYTYTLPTATGNAFRYNADNIYLVGIVYEYNSSKLKRAVLNATEAKLTSNPETVGVKEIASTVKSAVIFPNPATTSTNLMMDVNTSGNATISVINVLGEVVMTQSASLTAGQNNVTINTANLAEGTYNVIIATKEGSISKKLNVVR
ncbi:MAG: choice-of-anchor J domain-containing protein [Bacteroidetes bacterium]|nr:choice-of-anchor J domain-containing protein [Bacteroidota bacterium]